MKHADSTNLFFSVQYDFESFALVIAKRCDSFVRPLRDLRHFIGRCASNFFRSDKVKGVDEQRGWKKTSERVHALVAWLYALARRSG